MPALAPSRTFARSEIYPSSFVNRESRHESNSAYNFRVRVASGTTIEVPAGSGNDAAVISIDNLRRYVEATVSAAHPGGAAGTYDAYVTTAADVISNTPLSNTDNTVYTFALVVRATGSPPTGVGAYRRVATVEWSGTAITAVNQLVAPSGTVQAQHPTASFTGETPLRVEGFSTGHTAALMTVARSSGEAPLWSISPAGQVAVSATGSAGGVLVGGDAQLYRSGANHLAVGSGDLLDLSVSGGTDVSAGTATGDKVLFHSAGYGVGAQSNRLVMYVPSGAAVAVRQASGAGQKSGGTDKVVLGADGGITCSYINFTLPLYLPDGLVGTPSLAFADDTDTGLFSTAGDTGVIGFSSNGTERLRVSTTGASVTGSLAVSGVVSIADGTAATPSLAFGDDLNTGVFSVAGDSGVVAVSSNGAEALRVAAGGNLLLAKTTDDANGRIQLAAGTTAAVGLVFGNDATQANLYRSAASTLKTDGSLTVVGTLTTTTQAPGDSTTKAASTAFVQAAVGTLDPTLTALAAYNSSGLMTQTAADTFTGRSIAGTANQITVTNGSGVGGNPTLSLPATLDGVTGLSGGSLSLTATGAFLQRAATALTTQVFGSRASGGANDAFAYDAAGKMTWGDGTAAADTNLYRSAVDTLKTDDFFVSREGVDAQTGTAYTYADSDASKLITMTNAAANTITLPSGKAVGTWCDVAQGGAGATTFAAGAGATIHSFGGNLKLAGRYASATAVVVATDEWWVFGNLIA